MLATIIIHGRCLELELDVIEALQYFNSEDGPHISVNKLAIYCGINENTMRDYMKRRYKPPDKIRR